MIYDEWRTTIFNLLNKKRESITDIRQFEGLLTIAYKNNYLKGFNLSFFTNLFKENQTEFTAYKRRKLNALIKECDVLEELQNSYTKTYRVFSGYAYDEYGNYKECYKPAKAIIKTKFYNIKECDKNG